MKKALRIALKDLLVSFRDSAGLIMMLITPFALTLVMFFAFGGSSDGEILSDIPVLVVNHDAGDVSLGAYLVEVFQSEDLAELIDAEVVLDEVAARARVDADEAAAAVIIPAGLTGRLIPQNPTASLGEPAVIEVYANPTRSISVGVVRGIVEYFCARVTAGTVGAQVTILQMVTSGRLSPDQVEGRAYEIGQRVALGTTGDSLIEVQTVQGEDNGQEEFDWMGYMAPSMAIFFLMFTTTTGGRSILHEQEGGTLPRLLVTPTSAASVLGGKMLGTWLTGLGQMILLMVGTRWLLGADWGPLVVVAPLLVTLVAAATGFGMIVAALSRTPAQAGAMGTAMVLIFGAFSGNMLPRPALPQWMRVASYVSPNAWGLEAFLEIQSGGGLSDLGGILAALVGLAVVTFGVAAWAFHRRLSKGEIHG